MSVKSIMVFPIFPWWLASAGALAGAADQNHIHSGATYSFARRKCLNHQPRDLETLISPQWPNQRPGREERINRKVFSSSKRPTFENHSLHKATAHNYVFIAGYTIKIPCNFMVGDVAILRPQFCFGFVCLRFVVWEVLHLCFSKPSSDVFAFL